MFISIQSIISYFNINVKTNNCTFYKLSIIILWTMKLFEENVISMQKGTKVKIIILSIIAAFIVIYLGISIYYSNRFLMGTTINGLDCSEMTVEEVEAYIQEEIEKYTLIIKADNLGDEEIHAKDFDIKYTKMKIIAEAMEEQNSFAWPAALFKENAIESKVKFDYDKEKLSELISKLSCLKEENQKEAVAAIPVLKGNKYEVKPEELGTVVDTDLLNALILRSIREMVPELSLRESGCYVAPKFTSESTQVLAAVDLMNTCLETSITYGLDSLTVKLDSKNIKEWLSVDEDMTVILSEDGLNDFVKTLANTFNTEPRTEYITTPTGKSAYVKGATRGRSIDKQAEYDQLMKDIFEGNVVRRQPMIAQYATPQGQYAWGKTYVEVDISAQHMWYIKNGSVIFECDVVTGSPGRDTPSGIFEILTKKRDKVLRGNIDPVTGEREYETPVDYWARITWTGVGFHDATWQPAFGGQLYKQGYGSHGCINMPYNAVATFYGLISVGDPVVVHY